ncbi:ribosome silencing factor [Candidatus Uabimicrobium sp. HlEnr_7]|uniref:ribosome silencing factor n=1 Tax=Candidatus Uabimicrobium helgolandensis TaxID=3095367 RepID=UPI00355878F5
MDSIELAQICAKHAHDRKAQEVSILHVEKNFVIADYFVVCTGNTEKHVKAISQEIEIELKKQHKEKCHHIEGYQEGKWILMDFIDVIVHIYLEGMREFYEIEDLWADSPKIEFETSSGS